MMRFDDLFQRTYDRENFNCLHFVVEAQKVLFGRDSSFLINGLEQEEGGMFRLSGLARFKGFRRLPKPENSCLVLFRGVAPDDTHIGTYIDGGVLHISSAGVQYLPLEVVAIGFTEVLFYAFLNVD